MTIVSFYDMFHINNNHNRLKKEKKKRKFYFKLLFKFVDLEFVLTLDYGNNAKHRY